MELRLPRPWLVIFKKILIERYQLRCAEFTSQRNDTIFQIQRLTNKLEKARELVLTGDFLIEDFKAVRVEYEMKTESLEKSLNKYPPDLNQFKVSLIDKGNSLLRLYDYYVKADVELKRAIIDKLFNGHLNTTAWFVNWGKSSQLRSNQFWE